jgi:formate hydrogenlyase subunit 4
VLAAVAFFLVVLVDTGRIPVETHSGTLEFGMIDEARTLEHSGPPLALLKWGSAMKQLILYTILINVFVAPWGLADSGNPGSVALAIPALLGKAMALGLVFAVIDNLFSKLRLFKITEFLAAAFVMAVLAVLVFYAGGG